MQIDLGEGKYAEIKEIDELRSGDCMAVNAAVMLRVDQETNQAVIPGDMDDMRRVALAKRIITGWNLEWPIPSRRADSMEKLTLPQMSKLWAGLSEHLKAISEMKDNDPGVRDSDPTGA